MTIKQYEEIKEKYPKSFELFCKELDLWFSSYKFVFRNMDNDISPCFCDVVDFFDSQGVMIGIWYSYIFKTYMYSLCSKTDKVYESEYKKKRMRPKAQTEATYKAFSILEERLK
jgi:hypothetical protein